MDAHRRHLLVELLDWLRRLDDLDYTDRAAVDRRLAEREDLEHRIRAAMEADDSD